MTLRKYVPAIGKTVKMKDFNDYTSRGIHVWAHLKVIAIVDEIVSFQVLNGQTETNHFSSCPLSAIDPPIGWEERYTIYCKDLEQANKIVSDWFTRGIVVRQSHNLNPSYMPKAFQPMDNSNTPHWQFPEITDSILPKDCPKLFRVIVVTEEEITGKLLGLTDPNCNRCNGTGKDTVSRLASVREQTEDEIRALISESEIRVDGFDANAGTFECNCHYRAVSGLGRTKRAKLFNELKKDGWKIERVPYAGGYWIRHKETVIHEWED